MSSSEEEYSTPTNSTILVSKRIDQFGTKPNNQTDEVRVDTNRYSINQRIERQETGVLSGSSPQTSRENYPDGAAVQIYGTDENDQYKINFNAIKSIFEKVQDKLIAIYCISGKYRGGKSAIQSLFLKYLINGHRENWMDIEIGNSFKYSNSAVRVTTGISIWSQPVIKRNRDGNEVAIFLMDTQGWFDDRTSNYDNGLIFALATLLSSVMIFNISKIVGEDDFNHLYNFSYEAKIDKRNKDQPFPQLTFLIRDWISTSDFPHGYYDQNKPINRNYVKDLFNLEKYKLYQVKKNREMILSTYETVSAYLMPRPLDDAIDDNLFNSKTMGQRFISNLKDLISNLFDENSIVAKKFAGNYITGQQLIELVGQWCGEYDNIKFLDINTALPDQEQNTDDYKLSYQLAVDYFNEKMREKTSDTLELDQLQSSLKEMREVSEESKAIFITNHNLSDEELTRKYVHNLVDELEFNRRNYTTILDIMIERKKLQNNRNSFSDCEDQPNNNETLKQMLNRLNELNKQISNKREAIDVDRRSKRKNWFKKFIGVFGFA